VREIATYQGAPASRWADPSREPPSSLWADPAWRPPPQEAFIKFGPQEHDYEHAADVDILVPLAGHPGGSYRFRTNNLGLRRDDDTTVAKAPDTFRLLVLGDSQTDGYVNNDEAFCALLEARLASRFAAEGRRLEVLNAGVTEYDPTDEARWFRAHGMDLRPDLVLETVYIGNDLEWWHGAWSRQTAVEARRLEEAQSGVGTPVHYLRDLRLRSLLLYAGQTEPIAGA
jgi:hypothetical protein